MPATAPHDHGRTRNIRRRLRHVALELAHSSAGGATIVAALSAGVGVAASLSAGVVCVVAASTVLVVFIIARKLARVDRAIRNAEDATFIAAGAGFPPPAIGTWSIEADFALLILNEMKEPPTHLVEFGAGSSTL